MSGTTAIKAKRSMLCNDVSSAPDMEEDFIVLYQRCRAMTMTSLERMYGLYQGVKHVVTHGIEGDVVECGVWKGGSAMLAALALMAMGDTRRRIFLYDTFTGMTEPGESDVKYDGVSAASLHRANWCASPLDEVRANMRATGYPEDRIEYVPGRVEETIPGRVPGKIAILRLDTDWYESTHHELTHLYPLLSSGGVLIVDDYGHWLGCRRAVDEYFAERKERMLLTRLDYTGRMGVKG